MNAKHFSILIFIICIAASGMARGASPAEQAGSDIRNMISKGNSLFQKGDFKHAAASWENALTVLDVGQFPDIHMDILPYLAHTCKTLGLHEKALGAFNRALPVAEKSSKHDRKALFFSHLADIHLTLANMENAVIFMEKAIAEAQLSKDPVILADILNNAGNLFIADGNYQEAAGIYRECLELLKNTADTAELKAKILINMAFAESFLGKLRADTLEKALEHTHSLPDAHIKAENYITLSLLMREFVKGEGIAGNPLTEKILKALTEVRRISETLNNPRLMSQAYGHMGQLYENEERHDEALRLTRRAAFFAQQANMPELLYLWQWQTGRLLGAQEHTEAAIEAYDTAIETLNPIRLQLFRGYRSRKDNFDKNIKPVYIGLTALYLKQADALRDEKLREEKLKKARDTMEILKSAELQNFFKDECVTYQEDDTASLDRTPPHTAVLYPVSLEDRLILLLSLPDTMIHFNVPVESRELGQKARQLRRGLQTRSSYGFLKDAKIMYDWLIRPVEDELSANEINTLIVAPDGALRLIPFSALNDGKHFLIEKYAVGTVPSVRLTASGAFQAESSEVLLGGLSDAVQEFTPLPGVKDELSEVRQITDARDMLFNADFTVPNLTGKFKDNPVGILHLATHGVFGGTAKDSFLLTYDSRLDMDRLEDLVRLGRFRDQKVELLTLSACQTAMGNERAALGLAGVAVKAGVKSAVATLWFVDDEATSLTIQELYRQLKNPDLSKAQALQNAQRKLIAQRRFWHPIYWAPFLLIGNWM